MTRSDLLSLNFYNHTPFHGSENGLRYRVEKSVEDSEEVEKKEPRLKVTLWPEPFNFDKTPDDKKEVRFFPFSEEGLLSATDYINSGLNH